jgi:phosphoglycolate phosphatase
MKPTVYLFDVDGTLTNTAHIWIEVYEASLRHLGITPPDEREIAKHTHDFKSATALGIREVDIPIFSKDIWQRADEVVHSAPLHADALAVLAKLRKLGHKTGVVSSMYREKLDRTLHEQGIEVDVIVGGGDVPHNKPSPEGILFALKQLGVEPSLDNVIYFGDKETDIEAAHAAGVRAVHFFPKEHQLLYDLKDIKTEPHERLLSWAELLERL